MSKNNSEMFKGINFDGLLQEAIEKHAQFVVGNAGRTLYTEPSLHDIMYHLDPITGKRRIFPDGVPIEPSLGELEQESLSDRVRRQTAQQAMQAWADMGPETLEDAMDFDVDELQNIDPFTGNEYTEETEANDAEVLRINLEHRAEQERLNKLAADREQYLAMKKHYEPELQPQPQPEGKVPATTPAETK